MHDRDNLLRVTSGIQIRSGFFTLSDYSRIFRIFGNVLLLHPIPRLRQPRSLGRSIHARRDSACNLQDR